MNYQIKEYLWITLGVIITSIGLKAFLIPNGFLDGGITGLAILIKVLVDIPTHFSLLILTIPFLILAYYKISRKVAIKSVYSILLLSGILYFENFDVITTDKLLICFFGGLFVGAGIGISIKNGAVLDGSEIIALWFNNKLGLSIGSITLAFNIILFLFTAILVDAETAMYSTLVFVVTAKVIDFIIKGFEEFIGVMVVSEELEAIQKAIETNIGAGYTVFTESEGLGNSGEKRGQKVLQTIVNRIDLNKLHSIIKQIDPNAFVIDYDVNNISGGIFRKYLPKF